MLFRSKKAEELQIYKAAMERLPKDVPLDDWTAFAKATKQKATILKKVRPFITEKDQTAKAVEGEADPDLRDTEIVPFTYEGGINAYMKNEVLTYSPDAYVDEKKTQVGYEVSFTKYFYKPVKLRPMKDIIGDLKALETEAYGMLNGIIGEIQ